MNKKEQADTRERVVVPLLRESKDIAEAIIVEGKPVFLIRSGTEDQFDLGDRVIIPPAHSQYIGRPYTFCDKAELDVLIAMAKDETIDSLFGRWFRIVKKLIDADLDQQHLISADIVSSYFQDSLPAVHYLFFIGGNGTGKSSRLGVFAEGAYRAVSTVDLTPANIYQLLGQEESACTLVIDEADNIDRSPELLRILKAGYTHGAKVLRTDTSLGRIQRAYFTYCMKVMAAERLPDSRRARGFLQRTIVQECLPGLPKFDIQEVMTPTEDGEYAELRNEIDQARKLCMIYRVLNYEKGLPNPKTNLKGREKQLFSALIRIFYGTTSFSIIAGLVTKLVRQYRQNNLKSFHGFLFTTVRDLVAAQNTNEIPNSLLWSTIVNTLEGQEKGSSAYYSVQHGIISRRAVRNICLEVLGAIESRQGNIRTLVFDPVKLEKLAQVLDPPDFELDAAPGTPDSPDQA